jgi:hypothetical protein
MVFQKTCSQIYLYFANCVGAHDGCSLPLSDQSQDRDSEQFLEALVGPAQKRCLKGTSLRSGRWVYDSAFAYVAKDLSIA